MPELAEVAYYAKQWDAGKRLPVAEVCAHEKSRVFRRCDLPALISGLKGSALIRSHSHGKQMLFEFSGGHWLTLHLGMTGELSTKPHPFSPTKHDHLVLHTQMIDLIFTDSRQFGSIQYHCGDKPPTSWLKLPTQIMDADFTLDRLRAFLLRHSRQPLKALLLDQQFFPGIGNWMADEIMWQMRLHPLTTAATLNEKHLCALHRVLRKICAAALKTIGDDWSDPPKSWLFRHRWVKGRACPRCGTSLMRDAVQSRTACWCPVCQMTAKDDGRFNFLRPDSKAVCH